MVLSLPQMEIIRFFFSIMQIWVVWPLLFTSRERKVNFNTSRLIFRASKMFLFCFPCAALFAHEKEIKFGFEVLLSACCFYDCWDACKSWVATFFFQKKKSNFGKLFLKDLNLSKFLLSRFEFLIKFIFNQLCQPGCKKQ